VIFCLRYLLDLLDPCCIRYFVVRWISCSVHYWISCLWGKVAVDIVHIPPSEGFHYLLIAREDVSGWVEGRALRTGTAKAVAKFLWEDLICRHGIFGKLVVDGGPENKDVVEALTELYGIKRAVVSAYHPAANGMVERGHQPIVNALSKLTEGGRKKWTRFLHTVLWADRTTVRASTGMTPARVIYGNEHVLPIELTVPTWQVLPWSEVRSTSDLLAMRARQLERRDDDLKEALLRIRRHRQQNKEYFDDTHRIRPENLTEGMMVLLHDTKLEKSYSDKLTFRWKGPYRIAVAHPQKGTFELEELDGSRLQETVPGNRLKIFHQRSLADLAPGDAPNHVAEPDDLDELSDVGDDEQLLPELDEL